ncbi:hypothetical protein [Pseudomonas aeruginosa]|uniref:hypothetical protein n=1 Tax=Pseudomonas aeruginosa TaxID=287 RepID=UPI0021AD8508|nr:hypothetical protein [Pseudomonas aeruginosa]
MYANDVERRHAKETLWDIVHELGPVVDAYPTWHPLVSNNRNRLPVTRPSRECGYEGLDHTKFFAHGFITCPYNDGQAVIDSVKKLPRTGVAHISAERLDVKFYHPGTTAILVRCDWGRDLPNNMIPVSLAMPLLLERELQFWQVAEVAETWETMRGYFLGKPNGSRSSLFVNQDTGQKMKKIWEALINTGMFGPIMVE